VRGAEAVHLLDAEIGGDRIDLDLPHFPDLDNRLPKQLEIGHQAQHAVVAGFPHHLQDLDMIEIGTGSGQPWLDGILWVVFSCQQEHVALWRGAFATWPIPTTCYARRHVAEDLPLTFVWQSGQDPELAERKPVRPQPLDSRHLDGRD